MLCDEVFVMRTSDWKCAPMPSACATAGISSVLMGGLVSFGFGVDGETRLIDTGTPEEVVPVGPSLPDAFCVLVITRLASVEPSWKSASVMWTLTVTPSGGSGPLAGVTVMNGLSAVTLYVSLLASGVLPVARPVLPLAGKPLMKKGMLSEQSVPSTHLLRTGLRLFGWVLGGAMAMMRMLA